jgi:hypothetical protein
LARERQSDHALTSWSFFFVTFVPFCSSKGPPVHPKLEPSDRLSGEVIGAAIEVHRTLGSGLLERVHEERLMRELELRSLSAVKRQQVRM